MIAWYSVVLWRQRSSIVRSVISRVVQMSETHTEANASNGQKKSVDTDIYLPIGQGADESTQLDRSLSPLRFLAIIVGTVFSVEIVVVLYVEYILEESWHIESHAVEAAIEAVLYAIMLIVVVFPVLYYFSFRPLTLHIKERRQVEGQLRLQAAALNAAANGILITDWDGNIEWVNPAFVEMTGYARSEVLGRTPRVLKSGKHSLEFYETLWDRICNGLVWSGEMVNRRKDGSHYYEEQTIAPVRDEDGHICYFIAIKQDITARKTAEAQLERHIRELSIFSRLGQTMVSSLELEAVFAHVITQVMHLLHADSFYILLLEDSELVYRAVGGLDAESLQGTRISASHGVLGQVLDSGEPVLRSEPLLDGDTPGAMMIMPLQVGDNVIGLAQALNTTPATFDAEDLRMLQTAANWAAIAISHARQHTEIRRRLQETATLAAINQSLNETLVLDHLLQLIADSVPKLINKVDRVVIHLLNEEEQLLYPAIWSGQPEYGSPTLFLRPGEGIAGRAIAEGKIINLANVREDPRYLPHGTANTHLSLMVAPMQSGKRQLGTISVHSLTPGAFSLDNERVLMRLADSAAVAIETSRLYEYERSQRQLAEALVQAAAAFSTSLQLDEVLQVILEQSLQVVGCQGAAIFLLSEDDTYLVRSGGTEYTSALLLPEAQDQVQTDVAYQAIPQLRFMIETGKPIVFSQEQVGWMTPNEDDFTQMQSFAAAPMRVGGTHIGFLAVHSSKPGFFTAETTRRLEALAAHATLAVQNAQLYNDLEQALQQEQTMRDQLVQTEKLAAMGRMLASVAHELNNPIQTIRNCIFLTQQDSLPDSGIGRYLEMVLSETQRLSNLVQQLREVYRPRRNVALRPLPICQILDEVYLILDPHLKQHQVEWQLSIQTDNTIVNGVSDELKQVLLNICLNGIEAMGPDGGLMAIDVLSDPAGEQVGITINDSGPGILAENIPQLFDPFFTTKESGTGLGLAICYDIIQKHGGQITVESASGQGTAFTVWLPLKEQQSRT